MTKRKKLKWRPKPENTVTKNLKRISTPICILLTVTVFIVSFSLVSSASLFHPTAALSAITEQETIAPATTTQTSPSPIEQPTQWMDSKQQFHCDVIYAYVGRGNSEATHSLFGVPMYPKSQYPSIVYFNFTHVSNAEIESCDVEFEVYLIQISADKGPTENYTYIEGTNYRLSNRNSDLLTSLASHVKDLVDVRTINGRGGHFRFNWTTNTPITGGYVGSLGSYTNRPSGLGLWSAGEPKTISVSVRRIGWIIAKGSSISTFANTARDENITQIQLQKFGDGFIYNKIVPADKLSQINPFEPPIPPNEIEAP